MAAACPGLHKKAHPLHTQPQGQGVQGLSQVQSDNCCTHPCWPRNQNFSLRVPQEVLGIKIFTWGRHMVIPPGRLTENMDVK